ncbi:MAG: hypothetical protein WCK76_03965 [Elusimicrobiota bacterium]
MAVVLKNGVERKGELAASDKDSVSIRFRNGKVRKINIAEIDSVVDRKTKKDILPSLQSGDTAAEEESGAEEEPGAEEKPTAEEKPPAAKKPAAPRSAAAETSAAQAPGVKKNAKITIVLKNGVERKGELAAYGKDAVFIRFKNGKIKRISVAEISSVFDKETNEDILASLCGGPGADAEENAEAQASGKTGAAGETAEENAAAQAAAEKSAAAPAAGGKTVAAPAAPGKGAILQEAAGKGQLKFPAPKALPDNLMEWMAARYGAKTMLGLKWQNPNKARLHYAMEKDSIPGYGAGSFSVAGKPSALHGRSAGKKMPSARFDIMPYAQLDDIDATDVKTGSYLEMRITKPGTWVSWNMGYLKFSETATEDVYDLIQSVNTIDVTSGVRTRNTDASAVYASLVLSLPIENFSYYFFIGPALVSYDNVESGVSTLEHVVFFPYSDTSTPGTFDAKKSGTATTVMAGVGFAFRSASGFGIFGESKFIQEAGSFRGVDSFGAGLSFGF